jgi:ABC-type phosphate transport system substrate-binding protein
MRLALTLLLLLMTAAPIASAEPTAIRVIVHPRTPITSLDRKFVADAFLKKRTRWDDDGVIHPVDLKPSSAVRARFSDDVVGRSVAAVRRYWSQLVFSGRGLPPPELDSESAVIAYVVSHVGAIGYVSGTADLSGVKVVQVR